MGRPVGPVLYIFIPRIWTNITLSLPNSDFKHFCSICILLYENLRGSYLLDKYWFTDALQKIKHRNLWPMGFVWFHDVAFKERCVFWWNRFGVAPGTTRKVFWWNIFGVAPGTTGKSGLSLIVTERSRGCWEKSARILNSTWFLAQIHNFCTFCYNRQCVYRNRVDKNLGLYC